MSDTEYVVTMISHKLVTTCTPKHHALSTQRKRTKILATPAKPSVDTAVSRTAPLVDDVEVAEGEPDVADAPDVTPVLPAEADVAFCVEKPDEVAVVPGAPLVTVAEAVATPPWMARSETASVVVNASPLTLTTQLATPFAMVQYSAMVKDSSGIA
jgi:hypothetical protein